MLFSEIIGQENTKKQLIDSVQTSRMSHAQLFSGPEGSGSLPLAIAYAQYVSCTQQGADDSCGVCPSCRKYNKLAHPDLHFVFPVATTDKVKSKPVSDLFLPEWRDILLTNPYFSFNQWLEHIGVDNKQGLIGTEEAGEIIRKLTLKTYESDYKVMVIWMPEKMNDSSANKLLKMIEEPPLKTLFLLVSEHPEQIITTIISRTQLVKVPRIDRER
jgi:DNA polymerase-3 subunit delta'